MRNFFICALIACALVACPAPTAPAVNSQGVVGPEVTVPGLNLDQDPGPVMLESDGSSYNDTGFSVLPEEVMSEPAVAPLELDVDASAPVEGSDVEVDPEVSAELPLVSVMSHDDEGSCSC